MHYPISVISGYLLTEEEGEVALVHDVVDPDEQRRHGRRQGHHRLQIFLYHPTQPVETMLHWSAFAMVPRPSAIRNAVPPSSLHLHHYAAEWRSSGNLGRLKHPYFVPLFQF